MSRILTVNRRVVFRFCFAAVGVLSKGLPSRAAGGRWVYVQRTGNLYHSSPPVVKSLVGSGYSGYGEYKNDPNSQCYQDLGPIPRGAWTIGPLQDNTTSSGHVLMNSMRLTPGPSTDICQRDGFLMHGDNTTGVASAGCIVLPLAVRQSVGDSNDTDLTVVAEESDL